MKETSLRVAEAFQNDVGRGVCRIDSEARGAIGVGPGDIVEISGTKTTAAMVLRAHPEDEGKGIIRIEGNARKNAGVSIGDKVVVRKADVKEAKVATLAPVLPEGHAIRTEGIAELAKEGLANRPLVKGDIIVIPGIALMTGMLPFSVVSTQPAGIVQVTAETQIRVLEETVKEEIKPVTYEDIGGLKPELQKVREMIELPLKHPELFERLGIEAPKGILLHGPPGTGKTLIARAVANESGANFYTINGPEIMSAFYGQSEANLRRVFDEAQKNAPSIIFIDEIDAIAPKREEVHGEVEKRVVSQLLSLMDGLKSRGKLIVIGATNIPDSLDPALRRPGRFDRELVIGVPDRDGRKEILQIHTRGMPVEGDEKDRNALLDELANITHGFVGADLAALAREAAMHALRRYLPDIDMDKPVSPAMLRKMTVTKEDFKEALKDIEPSALREVFIEVPKVKWEDIGGLGNVKRELQESIEWPMAHPESFKHLGIKPPRGILLYGPPGTGKTLLAKAVATESGANFIGVRGPELFSKWVGESEKGVRQIFKKAKQAAPSIVFFDELDAIAPRRGVYEGSHVTESVVNQILTSMDGIESLEGVTVIGASNRPDMIDPALLRAGRFEKLIFVEPPDYDARLAIFRVHTKNMPLAKDVCLEDLAERTENCVGADIEAICRRAGMLALRENMNAKEVSAKHFETALKTVHPSVSKELIEAYKKMAKELGAAIAEKPTRAAGVEVA